MKTFFKLGAAVAVLVIISACGSEAGGDDTTAADTVSSAAPKTAEPAKSADTDDDGFVDSEDAFPNDDREWSDENSNGIGDNKDALVAKAKQAAAKARAKARQAKERAAAVANAAAPSKRTWAKVVKDPDAHTGEFYVVYGQITQFDAATGTDAFLADTAYRNTMSYGYFEGDNTWLTGRATRLSDFVADDVFSATVEVTGSFSYDTQAGGNTTVPNLKVLKINRVG